MLKRFISVSSALLLSITCLSSVVFAEETAPTRIYRTSITGTNVAKNGWDFSYSLSAYSNGNIHIDVQCEKSHSSNDCNQIGSIQFDDSVIAAIGESGYAGTSSFSDSGNSSSKYTTSYNSNGIVYNAIYSGDDPFNHLTGSTLMSFELYVKEAYLSSPVSLIFFGKTLEVPFGAETPLTDNTEMQKTITNLKAENEALTKQNTENATKIADLESKNKELETSVQNYETENSSLKSQNQALASSINKFDTENAALKATLAAIDSDSDDLLTAADAQAVLNYYVAHLAGKATGKVSDYAEYSKQKG